jgi:type I restriction enzyme S subunit
MIAKKRDLKQAAMQHLLTGKTRLPGFSGEWEVKRLGELCAMRSGEGITAKSIDESSAYPCYGGNGLRGYTTRFTHQGRYALIGRVGALCGNILLTDGKFFASEHAIVVTALDRVDIGWLAVILDTLGLNRRAESSAQPVLTVSKLLILEVLAPPTKAEQSAIAEALSDMDADLAALEAQAAKARAVKQGMMQELLTGRVRLV